jgi:hypothetical protein
MMTRFNSILFAVAVAACSKDTGTGTNSDKVPGFGKVAPAEVSVELSGVTLADDCGDVTERVPPPSQPKAAAGSSTKPSAAESISAGACADPRNCHGPTQPPCEPTSMQLSLRAPADVKATTLRITKVELLDGGKVVDTLAARKPSKWDDKGTYVTWDEAIAPDQTIQASYLMSPPDWNKLTGGKYNAHTKVFNLRVTFTTGNAEKTIEKQAITPVAIEPAVST